MDVRAIKHKVDILALAEKDTRLQRVASTGGGEYAGPCPFCGGEDRFRVQPNHPTGGRWFCRGCGDERWHDVIDYIMRRDSLSFQYACKKLVGEADTGEITFRHSNLSDAAKSLPPSEKWQARGNLLCSKYQQVLWTPQGKVGLEYLLNERGLHETTIRKYGLGYNPVDHYDTGYLWGLPKHQKVFIPEGITIPGTETSAGHRTLWSIKIRRLTDEKSDRYRVVCGSSPFLFGCNNLIDCNNSALLTEGEFDCILADQEIGHLVKPATLGSANKSLDLKQWGPYLMTIPKVIIVYDYDPAGGKGLSKLISSSKCFYPVDVPVLRPRDKDLTDYYLAGGDLKAWIEYVLAQIQVSRLK